MMSIRLVSVPLDYLRDLHRRACNELPDYKGSYGELMLRRAIEAPPLDTMASGNTRPHLPL